MKEEIPFNVMWAMAILHMQQPVGKATLGKIVETINDNPKYFPWEHKYKSVPKEVHDAFNKECYPPKEHVIDMENTKGIMEQITIQSTYPPKDFSFTDFLNNIAEKEQERIDKVLAKEKAKKEEALQIRKDKKTIKKK